MASNIHGPLDGIKFIKKILVGAPQRVGVRRAWDIYNDIKNGGSVYIEKVYGSGTFSRDVPTFDNFEQFKMLHRSAVGSVTRDEENAKKPKRRRAQAENEGYSEPVHEPDLTHWRFSKDNQINSLVEDKWRADKYGQMCAMMGDTLRPSTLPGKSDQFDSVYRRAAVQYIRSKLRPVLTNEVADYANPYMLKKKATENLLFEAGCVRTKLEESLVGELLEGHSADLIKARCNAQSELPGEVLEPLQAFAGLTDWSQDPQIRIIQKIRGIRSLLGELCTIENQPQGSDWKYNHPYGNHISFESTVPTGRTGGWGFGKPRSDTQLEMSKMRYPTLQRVAHTLSRDHQYNRQVKHAINVLERSKGWSFQDKTRAVNSIKEVLDSLPASKTLIRQLDRALPIRTLTKRGGLIRYKPSNLRRRNRIRMYFRSMTAITSLNKRWSERRAKNVVRAKKDKKK